MENCVMKKKLALLFVLAGMTTALSEGSNGDYPYTPTPFNSVQVDGGFWEARMETNREVTVRYCFKKCEDTSRIDNFAVAGGLKEGGFMGIYFNDSDVFKVIEGAAYSLQLKKDEKLDDYLDGLIAKIAAAQEEDGYLYTARTIGDPKYNYPGKQGRWSHLGHGHELYNVGHMYEAAVAHHQATGKRSLLDVAIKNADMVCKTFGLGKGQLIDVPGHEEIEIGLVKLYRLTGDEKYLKQAKFFIDMRGRKDLRGKVYGKYAQDHIPLLEQREAVGHAVRGGYLYAGVADVAALTGNKDYVEAIDRIWQDVIDSKVYITGSVGQHGAGEGYAGPWKLDNLKAYNETCASVALALWNHRMFLLHGDSKYIDELERTLYNGFLSGVSLSGDRFFYPNPLACDMKFKFNGSLERSPWFGCSCCPTNVVRFLPSVAGMVYAQQDDTAYVNLFVQGTGTIQLKDRTVKIAQETDYPWSGKIKLTITPDKPGKFALHIRIPGWATDTAISSDLYRIMEGHKTGWKPRWIVNGKVHSSSLEKGYAVVRRSWKAGDKVELDLPMRPKRILAHNNVTVDRGRTAIMRGPVVYCIEGADHDGEALNIFLPDEVRLTAEHCGKLLGGVTVLKGKALVANREKDGSIRTKPIGLTMIPYYAWCHRGANLMQVWLPRTVEHTQVAPMPTIASTSKASASHIYQSDSVSALNNQQEPGSSGDHSIARHTWWDHKGTGEWVQYSFDKAHKVSSVDVYWFDDTGLGQCRVPKRWRVLYKENDLWQRAHQKEWLPASKDKFDHAAFKPVTTSGLRIEVQLQPGYSGGILEWRVNQ